MDDQPMQLPRGVRALSMLVAAVGIVGPGEQAASAGHGYRRTGDEQARIRLERAKAASLLIAKAEAKRARRRARNLLRQSNG